VRVKEVLTLVAILLLITGASSYLSYKTGHGEGQVAACSKIIPIAPLLKLLVKDCLVEKQQLILILGDDSELNVDRLYEEEDATEDSTASE